MRSLSWFLRTLSMETRKMLSYRVDFWVGFGGDLLVQFCVAYFLWAAIYAFRGAEKIGGYQFTEILFYSFCVPFIGKMIRSKDMGGFSREIYDGSLTRYLIYPVNAFGYRYALQLAQTLMFSLQFALAYGLIHKAFRLPFEFQWKWMAAGFIAVFFSSLLFFAVINMVELIAFWVDQIWSLLVMLRFIINFLGGALIPVSFFPEGIRESLHWMPFYYLVGFPIEIFMGKLSPQLIAGGFLTTLLWALAFGFITAWLWRRGVRQYTGVGI